MKFTVITANYNGGAYLETAMKSVLAQRSGGVELEYIVVDGGSTDDSLDLIRRFEPRIDVLIVEDDTGPANAINKGLRAATGDIVSWLNADDVYYPEALARVRAVMAQHPKAAFCFGACPIIDTRGKEIRRPITRFKEMFFPVSSQFALQCLNYISQPATFIRKAAMVRAGWLNENLTAAWDYDFWLRLLAHGTGVRVKGAPLAAFRWHEGSIGGRRFADQFREELACTIHDAGPMAPQTLIHHGVRWGIVGIYTVMGRLRAQERLG